MEFVTENDSVRLQYNFNGENAPINITIYNKLNVPMYIDWQRSALIVQDKAISYVPTEVPIQGSYNGSSVGAAVGRGISSTSSSGSINATAILPEHIAFVPPNSYVTKMPMGVTNRFIENVPDTAWHKERLTDSYGLTLGIKRAAFTDSTSPLHFKSYLTIMVGAEQAKPTVFENSFYVAELITSGQPLESIWINKAYQGNRYFVREATGAGAAATGFVVIAGVAALAATSHSTNGGSSQ
jgi:hypothetical protein